MLSSVCRSRLSRPQPILATFVRHYERPAKPEPPLRTNNYFIAKAEKAQREQVARLERCAKENQAIIVDHQPFVNPHFVRTQHLERMAQSEETNNIDESPEDDDAAPSVQAPVSQDSSANPLVFAVFIDRGNQIKCCVDDVVMVDSMDVNVGDILTFNQVLLLGSAGHSMLGRPHVADANVTAVVEEHGQTDKILVFHKKRRKNHKKMQGHRSLVTVLRIQSIQLPSSFPTQATVTPAAEQQQSQTIQSEQ